MPRFTFVIGKGGVGKTTVSSALALYTATQRPRARVLLLSTDPAHSLEDVLQVSLSDRARKLRPSEKLYARQLDAESSVAEFLEAQREGILRILESGSLFTREELGPLLDSALPGMSEVAALLTIHDLLDSDFEEVVIDTAPMGHTLRLFELPAHLERFLRLLEIAGSRDQVLAAHFGGRVTENPHLALWQEMVRRVAWALSRDHARLVLVTAPEKFSLNESLRARDQLRNAPVPLGVDEVVLNRAVVDPGDCERCNRTAKRTAHAERFLERQFAGVPLRMALDPGGPILGAEALLAFGKQIFGHDTSKPASAKPVRRNSLALKKVEWPTLDVPLTLTVGKGGVGKTTISAGLAFHSRQKHPSQTVTICSIDPAPSLDDVFETDVQSQLRPVLKDSKLRAAEIDAVAEYQRWADEMKQKVEAATSTEVRGVHLDLSFERDLFLALLDVVPPGVDEIFATFRILNLIAERGRVQIDMAPTGHALEVLRTPARLLGWARLLLKTLAHHRTLPLARDAAVEIATVSQRVRELASALTDSQQSSVWVVMLAEPLPDRETQRLIASLQTMKASLSGVIVNRVLRCHDDCARCERTIASQRQTIDTIRKWKLPVYVVPEFENEIAGKPGLQKLTKSLWRLQ